MVRTYDPTGFRINSRTAENINDAQVADHNAQLLKNGVSIPTQGLQVDEYGQPTSVDGRSGRTGADALADIKSRAAGGSLSPQDLAALGNVNLGTTSLGEIDQSAIDRLMKSGMSYGEALQNVQGNREDIQQAFNQVGTNSGAIADPKVLERQQNRIRTGDELTQRLQDVERRMAGDTIENIATAKQLEISKFNAEQAMEDAAQGEQQQRTEKSAAAGEKSDATNQGAATVDPAVAAVVSMLPQGMEGLAPVIQNLMQSNRDAVAGYEGLGNTLLQRMEEQGRTTEEKLDKLAADARGDSDKIQGFLDEMAERQERNIAEQEKAARERLELNVLRGRRETAVKEQRAVDSKIAEIALKGRIQSDGASAELDGIHRHYEGELADLEMEAGAQRTELSAKFTGLYTQVMDSYYLNSISNLKDTNARLERITMQDIQSGEARSAAENSIIEKMVTAAIGERKSAAADIYKIAQDIQTERNRIRDDARSQEQLGWQRLNWALDTYGTGNVPPAILQGLRSLMPGIDVDAISKAPTAADRKRVSGGRGGGGGSGFSFSVSQRMPNGQPIALDQFIAQKTADYQAAHGGGVRSVEIPPEQKKAWEKEYNGMKASADALSPVQISRDLAKKAAYFPNVTSFEAAQNEVQTMLNGGEYDAARSFVDSLGKPLSDNASKTYKSLGTIQSALGEMEVLLDRIQDKVGPFPTEGPLWAWMSEHLETDPDYQRLLVLRGSTVAPYARGVSSETGTLTDPDVQRAAAGVLDPNVSYAAMRAGLQQAKSLTNAAIQTNLSIDRANGRAVADIDHYFQAQSTAVEDPAASLLTPEQQQWLNSL